MRKKRARRRVGGRLLFRRGSTIPAGKRNVHSRAVFSL